jgi:tetratricopeptide (TPR) repeat protein
MLYDLVRRDYRRLRPAVRHTALEYLLPNISQCAVLLLETVDPTTRPNSIPSDEAWEKLERLYRLETKSTAEVEAWLRRAFKRSVEMGAEATLQLAQIARGFGLADLALEFCNSPGSGFGEQQGEAGEILAARGRLGSAVGSYARLRMGGIFYRVDDEVEVLLRSGLFDQAKSLQQRRFLLPLVGVQQAMTRELDASSAFSSVSRKLFEQNKVEASAEYGSLAYLLASPYRSQSYIAADGLARSLEELERFRESADVRRASMVELLYGSSDINQIFSSPEMVMSYFPSLKQTVVQERLERAAVLIASGGVDSAIHEIEIAMAADPQHIEIAIQTVPLLAAEHPEAADRIFDVLDREMQSVLTRWPKNAFTLNNLAWMYAKCGRKLDEAHDLATRATLVAPKSATYLDTLAEVQFMQGDVEAAIKSARMCVQIDPREAHYRENIVRFRAARSKH